MKAWICRRFAAPFEIAIEDMPVPEPGPGEVRIRVHAAGLSFGETMVLEGRYQKTPPLPYIPSSEMAGVVDACGRGVTRLVPGQRVAAFSVSLDGGGLAEYCVLPQAFVHGIADDLAFADAAGFLMNHWTAFNALVRRGNLQAGEVLLVHGATGGTGSAALDVGRAIGATVIATGSDDAKLARVAADHRINHVTTPLRERILQITDGRGADVIFDPVGGDLFDQSMRAIATGGRLLVIGFTSGRPAMARTNVLLVKMISVIGVEGRLAIERMGEQGWNDFREMLAWTANGRLKPQAGTCFAFADARRGYAEILARKHAGKCVVLID